MDYEMGNHNCHDMTTLHKTNIEKDPDVNACTELQLSKDIEIRVNKSKKVTGTHQKIHYISQLGINNNNNNNNNNRNNNIYFIYPHGKLGYSSGHFLALKIKTSTSY